MRPNAVGSMVLHILLASSLALAGAAFACGARDIPGNIVPLPAPRGLMLLRGGGAVQDGEEGARGGTARVAGDARTAKKKSRDRVDSEDRKSAEDKKMMRAKGAQGRERHGGKVCRTGKRKTMESTEEGGSEVDDDTAEEAQCLHKKGHSDKDVEDVGAGRGFIKVGTMAVNVQSSQRRQQKRGGMSGADELAPAVDIEKREKGTAALASSRPVNPARSRQDENGGQRAASVKAQTKALDCAIEQRPTTATPVNVTAEVGKTLHFSGVPYAAKDQEIIDAVLAESGQEAVGLRWPNRHSKNCGWGFLDFRTCQSAAQVLFSSCSMEGRTIRFRRAAASVPADTAHQSKHGGEARKASCEDEQQVGHRRKPGKKERAEAKKRKGGSGKTLARKGVAEGEDAHLSDAARRKGRWGDRAARRAQQRASRNLVTPSLKRTRDHSARHKSIEADSSRGRGVAESRQHQQAQIGGSYEFV